MCNYSFDRYLCLSSIERTSLFIFFGPIFNPSYMPNAVINRAFISSLKHKQAVQRISIVSVTANGFENSKN